MNRGDPRLSRNRNFILLFLAYGVSAFGDHLSKFGLLKEMGVAEGDEKTRMGALMLFLFFLPYVLFGPWAGAIADRLPRRLIMIFSDLIRAGIAFLIPVYILLFEDKSNSLMLLPLFGLGVFAAFFNPARLSLVPEVVRDRNLTRANSLLNGLAPMAAIASMLLGGYWADLGRTDLNFYGDGATFLVSAVLVFAITLPATSKTQRRRRQSVVRDIRDGMAYIRGHRLCWQLMIFTGAFWTAAGAFQSVIPAVVFDWYALDYTELALFQGLVGVGMLTGAAVLTLLGEASRAHWNISVALVGAALSLALFSMIRIPWVGGVLALCVGAFGVWIAISANTLLQRIVPNHTRGKVFGIVDLTNMTGMILATGVLGVWRIPHLDAMVGWILWALAAALLILGIGVAWHHVRHSRLGMYLSFMRVVNEFYCKFWSRMRREGVCTIPSEGGCVVTANHTCGMDPNFVIAGSPRRLLGFMIAREYYDLLFWGRLIKALECIPVRRDSRDVAATKEALRHLRSGRALGIFIQGRIQPPGEPVQLRDGVAILALRSQVPVIPVHISGIKYSESVTRSFFRRHRVRIRYGKPVDLSEFAEAKDRQQIAQATERIWQAIQSLAPPGEPVFLDT